MESIVVLCNELRQMMITQCGAKPSLSTLNKSFAAYQSKRHARMKQIMDYSNLITKVQAWDTAFHKFVATWVLPLQPDRSVADDLGEIIRGASKLDFVSVENFAVGRLQWKDEHFKTLVGQKKGSGNSKHVGMVGILGVVALVFFIFVYAPSQRSGWGGHSHFRPQPNLTYASKGETDL